MPHPHWDRVPIDAQSIDAPLSRSAIFLVVGIGATAEALTQVRAMLAGIDDLVKTVGFRDLGGRLSCIAGIGSEAWDRLSPAKRPAELRKFAAIEGARHVAPSTAGDILFHIRADRPDLCFELERLILDALGESVTVIDEVSGFRYFDSRDLLGFVDGTANPTGTDLPSSALVGDEDPYFAGGSYVVAQKYVHDLQAWNGTENGIQEHVIGRTKLDNVEIDDSAGTRKSHKSLATIVDASGVEHDILRDNMPFGQPGGKVFGTYFIGYSRRLWVIEAMLQRMFVGDPPGSYDRLLDFSTALTGTTFFAPANHALKALASSAEPAVQPEAAR